MGEVQIIMSKRTNFYVVCVKRDSYRFPKLTVKILTEVPNLLAGARFITEMIMSLYEKRRTQKMGKYPSMRIEDYRVLDETGLKRLQSAAKASATLRRKRAAKKAAETRAKKAASATKEYDRDLAYASDYAWWNSDSRRRNEVN